MKIHPQQPRPIRIRVREDSSGWHTNRVAKHSGNSTAEAHCAAQRLAEKIFGANNFTLTLVSSAAGEHFYDLVGAPHE